MSEEITYYSDGVIQITNARAVLGGKSYAMANITSVGIWERPPDRTPGVALTVGGLVTGLCACCPALGTLGSHDSDVAGFGILFVVVGLLGLVMLIAGIAIAATAKPSYVMRLGSASGEIDALISKDLDYVQRIVDAVNKAIIERG